MKIWSDVEYVYRCLADRERVEAFRAGIEAAVRPGDVVLDLGTGSGILAILAARAGAARVYAAEIGGFLSRTARAIFDQSGYGDRIELLKLDARDITLDLITKPNVVVCEMMTTGMISEMQGPVLQALWQAGVIDRTTRLVPDAFSTSISLVSASFEFYGLAIPFPIFLDYFSDTLDRKSRPLSSEEVIQSIQFPNELQLDVRFEGTLLVETPGIINGLMLRSKTGFAAAGEFRESRSYCHPVVLPTSKIAVAARDTVAVALTYRQGEGFDGLWYRVWIEES